MHKSDKLINELIEQKIITDRLCDRRKAQQIIRQYFCEVFNEAVCSTVIACNKKNYVEPEFLD